MTKNEHRIILLADPEILAVPIHENHEPFVDLKDQNIIAVGPSPEIPNNTDYTKMRKSVYEMLVAAQAMLPQGLKFCLYEGYRSLTLQEKLFNERYDVVKNMHSTWTHTEAFIETTRLVSPVINLDGTQNIPPHSTGAAVDVYLINSAHEIIDMGIRVDEWMKDVDGSLSLTDSKTISASAHQYRNIMNHVLTEVGFVNYPTEYWHWSYGDRYWAYHKKADYAFYGSIVK